MEYKTDVNFLGEFNRLYNEYYSRFVRFANSYVRDMRISEDFVSEAFATFWENRKNLLSETNPRAYILTIIKNKCINHLQHQRIRQRVESELADHAEWLLNTQINTLEACNPEQIFSKEVEGIIRDTLARMPEKTRTIFIMNRHEGYSYKEIAERTNLSNKAVEFHISKALSMLRVSLKDFMHSAIIILYF